MSSPIPCEPLHHGHPLSIAIATSRSELIVQVLDTGTIMLRQITTGLLLDSLRRTEVEADENVLLGPHVGW